MSARKGLQTVGHVNDVVCIYCRVYTHLYAPLGRKPPSTATRKLVAFRLPPFGSRCVLAAERVVLVFAQSLIVDSKTDVLYTQLNANPQSKAVIDFMFNNKSSIFVITGADMDGDFVPNPLDFSRFVIPLPGMPLHLIRKSGEIRQTDMLSFPPC